MLRELTAEEWDFVAGGDDGGGGAGSADNSDNGNSTSNGLGGPDPSLEGASGYGPQTSFDPSSLVDPNQAVSDLYDAGRVLDQPGPAPVVDFGATGEFGGPEGGMGGTGDQNF
jgi:hypothetical protein